MKRISMAAVLFLFALTAQAQDSDRFRVGIGAAFSDYEGDSSYPVTDSGVGLQLYAQAMLSKSFGVEGGYYSSGGFKTDLDPSSDKEGDTRIAFSGFNLSLIGYFPIGGEDTDIDLYGKLGAFDYDIDWTTQESGSDIPGSLGHSAGVLLGVGAIINIGESIGIRTGFDWYDVDNADLWALTMGLDYRF